MRPRLVVHNVASVDGRLTLAPGLNLMIGDERWTAMMAELPDPYAWARSTHDPQVFLEGSGSFLNPEAGPLLGAEPVPAPEGAHFLPDDIVNVPGRRWFAVVDGAGVVDLQVTEWPDAAWAGWHSLVLTSGSAPAAHLELLRQRGIPYLVVGSQHVALGRALELLAELLGVETVVSSGGGRLGGALLRQGLADEIDVELLPWAIGGRGTPALFDAAPLAPGEWPAQLELLSSEVVGRGRVRLRYRVVR
ncbi:MAG TPA: dihydrofolate reductase family protein [Arachnia sp.]|nr:dihydrofolate reductase family protein [Arachnia sp.]